MSSTWVHLVVSADGYQLGRGQQAPATRGDYLARIGRAIEQRSDEFARTTRKVE